MSSSSVVLRLVVFRPAHPPPWGWNELLRGGMIKSRPIRTDGTDRKIGNTSVKGRVVLWLNGGLGKDVVRYDLPKRICRRRQGLCCNQGRRSDNDKNKSRLSASMNVNGGVYQGCMHVSRSRQGCGYNMFMSMIVRRGDGKRKECVL